LNGLSQGFAAFSRAFAPFISGFLWSEFADNDDDSPPRNWPVGPFLTWNVFGILCIIAFVGSIWIQKPKKINTDDAEDIEASID
jgi:MFS family permease